MRVEVTKCRRSWKEEKKLGQMPHISAHFEVGVADQQHGCKHADKDRDVSLVEAHGGERVHGLWSAKRGEEKRANAETKEMKERYLGKFLSKRRCRDRSACGRQLHEGRRQAS